MSISFKELIIDPRLQGALDTLGFTTPTEVQQAVLPVLIDKAPQDIHGQAQTGTGKTLAFGLPLITRIDVAQRCVQGLVVVPARELALQVFENLRPFAKALGIEMLVIYGGMSITDQISRLRKGVHLIIGTPGRLNDHIARGSLDLSTLKTLVLDEADIMFDMGFRADIEQLISSSSKTRELWLFAATVKPTINDFIEKYMKNPLVVSVGGEKVSTDNIQQHYAFVPFSYRMRALTRFIDREHKDFYGFIFCQTKILTAEVTDYLTARGYKVNSLHGDMGQEQRNLVIRNFRDKKLKIVVATDVAARGLDVPDLTHVINYSTPEDQETYVHRVGRTGRAGKKGISITFVGRSELRMLDGIKRKFNLTITPIQVPTREEIVDARLGVVAEFVDTMIESSGKNTMTAKIDELLQKYDVETFKNLTASLLHEKFFKDLHAEQDIPDFASQSANQVAGPEKAFLEISLNVGSEDGLPMEAIREHVITTSKTDAQHISRVRVSRHRTFVDVAREQADQFIANLQGTVLAEKTLFVQLVNNNNAPTTGGRSFDRGGDRGERSGGRERSLSYSGGGSRFGRSSRPSNGGSSSYGRSNDRGDRNDRGGDRPVRRRSSYDSMSSDVGGGSESNDYGSKQSFFERSRSERPSYDKPSYDKPSYDKPAYDKPSYGKSSGGYQGNRSDDFGGGFKRGGDRSRPYTPKKRDDSRSFHSND